MTICGYLSNALKLSWENLPSFGESNATVEIDPRVTKVMDVVLKSQAFRKLLAANPELLNKVKVHAYTAQECRLKGIKNAHLTYTPSSMFRSDSIDIYFDSSLPLTKQIRGVLIEFCNGKHLEDFIELDKLAKTGNLDREGYIYSKERMEWTACQEAFEMGEKIDALNLFEGDTIFNSLGKRGNQDFDLYLRIQKESGHSDKYGKYWDKITCSIPSS